MTLTENGTIRVTGSRVSLEAVVYQYEQGNSAEQIHESFPSLKLADIHAVISYYLNHRDQVNEYLRDQEKKARAVREDIDSDPAYKARSMNCGSGSSLATIHNVQANTQRGADEPEAHRRDRRSGRGRPRRHGLRIPLSR